MEIASRPSTRSLDAAVAASAAALAVVEKEASATTGEPFMAPTIAAASLCCTKSAYT